MNQYHNSMPSIMKCRLKKRDNGFGFNVKQRSSPPTLLVRELMRKGEAETSGLIRPGDMILKIDDIDVSQCSYDEALKVLMSTQSESLTSFTIRAPIGYTTRLETTFSNDGSPKTLRITEKIIKSITEKETSVEHKYNNNEILFTKRESLGSKDGQNITNSNLNLSVENHDNKCLNCENDKW
jgi:nitric-oxide synthase